MKLLIILTFTMSLSVFAQESSQKPTAASDQPVAKLVKEAKKTRKKKVAMCKECGKPEAECECEGHKK